MSVILFFIVLAVLVLSHEFGHFIAAKKSGMRVDEFGFGFPPRLFKFKKGETTYSVNAIPFGGFVKIPGEDGGEDGQLPEEGSFVSKTISARSLVLAAGVFFNILLAWFLIMGGYAIGTPVSVSASPAGAKIIDPRVVIIQISKDSPAEKAGIKVGDEIVGFSQVENVQVFIKQNVGKEISLRIKRDNDILSQSLTPRINPPPGEGSAGIAMDKIGIVRLPLGQAAWEGTKATYYVIINTALGMFYFVADAIKGTAGISSLVGPIGIVGITGSAAKMGFAYLLSFMAFLSVNLAIINILPFPALDGGRLLFLFIEKIKGSPISRKFSAIANSVGMALLLLLMLFVTYKDILKLVSQS